MTQPPVDHRRPALAALLLFVVLTIAANVLDGRLPASEESDAGWGAQVLAYLCAVWAGVRLMAPPADEGSRRSGSVVLAVTVVLALVDAVTSVQDGADVGAGFVRLLGLVVLAVVTARLARAVAADRRSRP